MTTGWHGALRRRRTPAVNPRRHLQLGAQRTPALVWDRFSPPAWLSSPQTLKVIHAFILWVSIHRAGAALLASRPVSGCGTGSLRSRNSLGTTLSMLIKTLERE